MFNIKRKRKEDDLSYLERVYRKILKKDHNSFLYLPLASIYYHKGNIEKAINTLQNGLSVHSSYTTAKYYLAFLYHENGEIDKAAELYKKVAFASRDHYAAHQALVHYYLDKKDDKSALKELKELARLSPSDLLIHDQINQLEQKLKADEKKTNEGGNVSEIIVNHLKKQNEEKKAKSEASEKFVSSLENWLRNIDKIYHSAARGLEPKGLPPNLPQKIC